MCKRLSCGFTLIELLIVIAIVGVLVGLLLPAVQQVRSAALRTRCGINLKQLGLAVLSHESFYGHLPAAELKNPGEHGWAVQVLPFIEQQTVLLAYDMNAKWHDPVNEPAVLTPLPIFACPATPEPNRLEVFEEIDKKTGAVKKSWRAACGDYAPTTKVSKDFIKLGWIPEVNERSLDGAITKSDDDDKGRFPRLSDIHDGASNTLLLAESAGRPAFWRGRRKFDVKVKKDGKQEPNKGGAWAAKESAFDIKPALSDGSVADDGKITGSGSPCAINCTNEKNIYSFHPGGAQAVFADGSVRFLRDSLPVATLIASVTRGGGETVPLE